MKLPFRLTWAYVYILFYTTVLSWVQNRKPTTSSYLWKWVIAFSCLAILDLTLSLKHLMKNIKTIFSYTAFFPFCFLLFCFVVDHCVHYYDLRNTKQPIMVFKGHRKAVSYAKFVSGEEIVSAWVLLFSEVELNVFVTSPAMGFVKSNNTVVHALLLK